jgi:hypothetical protein
MRGRTGDAAAATGGIDHGPGPVAGALGQVEGPWIFCIEAIRIGREYEMGALDVGHSMTGTVLVEQL